MGTASRLGLYGVGLLAVFGVAFVVAKPLVPDDVVARWTTAEPGHDAHPTPPTTDQHGLTLQAEGYALGAITAPTSPGTAGTLFFTITDATGAPVTDYATAHEQQLHLIVVRTDGTDYRHVHPQLNRQTGTWSLPWTWTDAGTYRVFADFTPSAHTESITVSRTVDVAGLLNPRPADTRSTTTTVDGYTATLTSSLTPGSSSEVKITLSRNGIAVKALQPYLGAFGHLVALRQGDLAYLHVHAMGEPPTPASTSGPDIEFMATAPSAGRYLLYLDFQIDGVVRTATFVLDAAPAGSADHGADGHGH